MILVVVGGARLTSALKNNIEYFGTDPNYILVERLNTLAKDFQECTHSERKVCIKPHGSEVFVKEWENTIGVAFSSPPYFCLEDYKVGEGQSYKEGVTYNSWKENYLTPTFKNIYRYLVENGYFILNINNFKDYDLVGDSIKIANQCGFTLLKYEKLVNIKRPKSVGGFNDNSEKIMVFVK